MGLFGLAQEILWCDDTNNLLVLDDRDTGIIPAFQDPENIVTVPRNFDVNNVGRHVVFYNHFCYDLTTMVVILL